MSIEHKSETVSPKGAAGKAFDIMDRGLLGIACVLTAALATLTFVEVISRYLFNASHEWSLELAMLLMLWAIFLGAGPVLPRGVHVNITIFTNRFKGNTRAWISAVTNAIGTVATLAMTIMGLQLVWGLYATRQLTESKVFYIWQISLSLPVGMAFLCLYFALEVYKTVISATEKKNIPSMADDR